MFNMPPQVGSSNSAGSFINPEDALNHSLEVNDIVRNNPVMGHSWQHMANDFPPFQLEDRLLFGASSQFRPSPFNQQSDNLDEFSPFGETPQFPDPFSSPPIPRIPPTPAIASDAQPIFFPLPSPHKVLTEKKMNVITWQGNHEESSMNTNQILSTALITIFFQLSQARGNRAEVAAKLMKDYEDLVEKFANFNAIARIFCVLPFNRNPAPIDLLLKIKNIYNQVFEEQGNYTTDAFLITAILEIKYRDLLLRKFSHLAGNIDYPPKIQTPAHEMIKAVLQIEEMSPALLFFAFFQDSDLSRDILKQLAVEAAKKGDFYPIEKYLEEASIEEVREIHAANPDFPTPHYYLAKDYENVDSNLAAFHFNQLHFLYQGQIPTGFLAPMGHFYFKCNDLNQSNAYFSEAIKRNWHTKNMTALERTFLVEAAMVKLDLNELVEADKLFTIVLESYKNQAPPIIRAQAASVKEGLKQFEIADKEFDEVIPLLRASEDPFLSTLLLKAANAKRERCYAKSKKDFTEVNHALALYKEALACLGDAFPEESLIDAAKLSKKYHNHDDNLYFMNLWYESVHRQGKQPDGALLFLAARANKGMMADKKSFAIYTEAFQIAEDKAEKVDLLYGAELNERFGNLPESDRLWDIFINRFGRLNAHKLGDQVFGDAARVKLKMGQMQAAESIYGMAIGIQNLLAGKRPYPLEHVLSADMVKEAARLKIRLKKFGEADKLYMGLQEYSKFESGLVRWNIFTAHLDLFAYVKFQLGKYQDANSLYHFAFSNPAYVGNGIESVANAAYNKLLLGDYNGADHLYSYYCKSKGIVHREDDMEDEQKGDSRKYPPMLMMHAYYANQLANYPEKEPFMLPSQDARKIDNHLQQVLAGNKSQMTPQMLALLYSQAGMIKEYLGDDKSAKLYRTLVSKMK